MRQHSSSSSPSTRQLVRTDAALRSLLLSCRRRRFPRQLCTARFPRASSSSARHLATAVFVRPFAAAAGVFAAATATVVGVGAGVVGGVAADSDKRWSAATSEYSGEEFVVVVVVVVLLPITNTAAMPHHFVGIRAVMPTCL